MTEWGYKVSRQSRFHVYLLKAYSPSTTQGHRRDLKKKKAFNIQLHVHKHYVNQVTEVCDGDVCNSSFFRSQLTSLYTNGIQAWTGQD